MTIVTAIRRWLRNFLLWLAARLDEPAAAPVLAGGGPPADWLQRVRRGAPQLLEPPAAERAARPEALPPRQTAAAPAPATAPPRTAGVPPAEVAAPRRHERRGDACATAAGTAAVRTYTRAVIEEELVARRSRTAHRFGGGSVPRLLPVLEDPARGADGFRAPASHESPTCAPAAPALEAGSVPRPRAASVLPQIVQRAPFTGEDAAARPWKHLAATTTAVPEPPVKARHIDAATASRWPDLPAEAGCDSMRRDAPMVTDSEERHAFRSTVTTTADGTFRAPGENPLPASDDRWPELPPRPPFEDELLRPVESLDDSGRLRRIAAEQRGAAWSE